MRLARFSLNDSPRYAFVQKDETDGKDYLIELDGHPLAGDQVKPTGTRYPVDGDGIGLSTPRSSPPRFTVWPRTMRPTPGSLRQGPQDMQMADPPEDMVIFAQAVHLGNRPERSDRVTGLLQGHELRAGSGRGDGTHRQERVR